jgi:hypothetical protein
VQIRSRSWLSSSRRHLAWSSSIDRMMGNNYYSSGFMGIITNMDKTMNGILIMDSKSRWIMSNGDSYHLIVGISTKQY